MEIVVSILQRTDDTGLVQNTVATYRAARASAALFPDTADRQRLVRLSPQLGQQRPRLAVLPADNPRLAPC